MGVCVTWHNLYLGMCAIWPLYVMLFSCHSSFHIHMWQLYVSNCDSWRIKVQHNPLFSWRNEGMTQCYEGDKGKEKQGLEKEGTKEMNPCWTLTDLAPSFKLLNMWFSNLFNYCNCLICFNVSYCLKKNINNIGLSKFQRMSGTIWRTPRQNTW